MSDPITTETAPAESTNERRGAGRVTWPTTLGGGHLLWTVCLLAIFGDLVTTVYGLGVGLREQNPFVAAVLVDYGVAGLVGLKLLVFAWVGVIWHVLNRRYGLAALLGIAVPQAIAVVLNLVTILSA